VRIRPWQPEVFDVLVVVVAAAAEVEIVLRDLDGPRWLLMPAVVCYTLPLVLRRRWPFAAPAFVVVVQVVVSFLDVPGTERESWGVVAYVMAFWVFGAHSPLGPAITGLGLGLAGVVVVTVEDVRVIPQDVYGIALVAALTWLAGVVLRRRTLRVVEAERRAVALEQDRRDAQVAVADERARIARELHDVVAHSVSVMTVQAGAARTMLRTDPERAVAPLLAVEESGRQALAELRRLLGVLRAEDGDTGLVPQPGLEDLPALLETVRDAGLPVQLHTSGAVRAVGPGVGLAAYRIVQEALTNTLKHAAAQQAWVSVEYGAEELGIEVVDDGHPEPGSADHRSGHGLAGMRERSSLYGGQLHAGFEPDGGYAVRARLPVDRAPT